MNTATVNHLLLTNSRQNIMSGAKKMFEKKENCLNITSDCVPLEHFFSDIEDVLIAHYDMFHRQNGHLFL
jgi:hypothetical protein